MAGGGVNYADANKELVAFAERYRIPVVSTLLGLGAMPIEHELSLAMGMHGSYAPIWLWIRLITLSILERDSMTA